MSRKKIKKDSGAFFHIDEMSLDTVLDFGKYRGYAIKEIINEDPRYLKWAIENTNQIRLPKKIADAVIAVADAEDYSTDLDLEPYCSYYDSYDDDD